MYDLLVHWLLPTDSPARSIKRDYARHSKLLQRIRAEPDAAFGLPQLRSRTGKDVRISYPCVMLNVMVAAHNTNDQYADLIDAATHTYATSSQMSIEFEVDGPYRVCLMAATAANSRSRGQGSRL